MRMLDFSSWQGLLSTVLALSLITLIGVGIRLAVMQTIQQRRQRENRQINERLRTLIAAYKSLGGSFTGELAVDATHMRDFIRQVLDLAPIPAGLTIPRQGPSRPSGSGGRGGGRDGADGRGARGARVVALLALLAIAGCATVPPGPRAPSPDAVRGDLVRHMPASLADRDGWAADIQTALAALDIAPTPENLCAVLAVTAQESGYQADPAVPNLPAVARGEITRRAAARRIPAFMVDAALRIRSSDGRTYDARLAEVRTERELSELYEDLTDKVPLGRRLFDGYNPVETGGPMQVGIAFAESRARDYPYPVDRSIRREVFTRRGGLYFGIAHLLDYETPYTRKVHRFADYNAGWYASRNAAFQHAVAVASGRTLALDGDLLVPGAPLDRPGETERALRSLSGELGMDDRALRDALQRGARLDFNDHPLFARVFALAEERGGVALPRERVPSIRLDSPKFSRELTTEWFATRVDARYRQCMAR